MRLIDWWLFSPKCKWFVIVRLLIISTSLTVCFKFNKQIWFSSIIDINIFWVWNSSIWACPSELLCAVINWINLILIGEKLRPSLGIESLNATTLIFKSIEPMAYSTIFLIYQTKNKFRKFNMEYFRVCHGFYIL